MNFTQCGQILVIVTLAACGMTQLVTFSGKEEQRMSCEVTTSTSAQWSERLANSTVVDLFSVSNGQVQPLKPNVRRYDDFSATWANDQFSLIITTVDKNDGGEYTCIRFGMATVTIMLEVEALPDSFDLTCSPSPSRKCGGPDETLPSSVDCTCTATEVSSPQSLQLQWSISPSNVIRNETQDAGDYFNLINEVRITPTNTQESVTCSVTGYQSEGIDSSLTMRTYNLVSPSCTLELIRYDEECTTAELNCTCSGGMPDAYTYSFFYGNKSRVRDSITPSIAVDIVADETFKFYCRGCNGIYGETSLDEKADIVCKPGTTAIPTTTTEPTTTVTTPIVTTSNPTTDNATTTEPSGTTDKNGPNGTDDGGGGNTAAIVGGVVGGCVGVAVIVIIIIVILKKRGNGVEGKSNTDKDFEVPQGGMNNTVTASTAATTNSAAPVYGVVNKSTKKKSDNTDGNGVNAKLASSPPEPTEPAEYASVNKPKSQPQAAPRSSAPPEKMELQYADLDHGNRGQSNEVRQPTNEPTEYATVQSVIV